MANKYILTVIFSLFYSIMLHAQKEVIDTIQHRFYYAAKISYVEGIRPRDDEVLVLIGKNKVYCGSRWKEEYYDICDSIRSHGGSTSDIISATAYIPVSLFPEITIKHETEKGMISGYVNFSKMFKYTEPIAEKNWTLLEGDTVIMGYRCHKAMCTHRKRIWTVWYTPEIPISEGPWKLDGLPGMILYAIDSKKQFKFDCFAADHNVNKPLYNYNTKCISITPERVQELRILSEENYEAYKKAIGFRTNSATASNRGKSKACLIETYE